MTNQMHQIACPASVQAAKDNAMASNATQISHYTGSGAKTIYLTISRSLPSRLLNVLAVIAILPTYRRWRRLGREFLLSLLEIVRAFDALLLRGTESNATWKQISERVGDCRVRDREVSQDSRRDDGGQTVKLQFADAKDARGPISSTRRRFR